LVVIAWIVWILLALFNLWVFSCAFTAYYQASSAYAEARLALQKAEVVVGMIDQLIKHIALIEGALGIPIGAVPFPESASTPAPENER
jgi:hypothetical protein